MKPDEIETLSFQIIDKEAGSHTFTPDEWSIVRRMIHTSADFDTMESVSFGNNPITAALSAIQRGCTLFTDTEMTKAGIRKKSLQTFGGSVKCYIGDPDVAQKAVLNGTTRACESVTKAIPELQGGIYVVGNAPTALLRIIDLIKNKTIDPSVILGFPVGFVNAAESKKALGDMSIPYITNRGRKGGSTMAASVVNALLILAEAQKGRSHD